MADYLVLARRYRPQRFCDVLGQEAIVTTLRNMIRLKRTAQAYLFCGSKGTGKTTLARLLAKALNCSSLTPEGEPCTQCASCREIAHGLSLDILEIDGASHRGIEDVRKINETVGYVSSPGRYKIYIIDEVHMLTKEAFNALLKTLEEPPPRVKFLFATTEVHKVLPTILSRCQRFQLQRIAPDVIAAKLRAIASDLHIAVDDEALRLIASLAEGGLRDAESLFDQLLAFQEETITAATVATVLGITPRDVYFELDRAGTEGNLGAAFEISHQLFTEGKDLPHFVEGLTGHLRNLLVVKVAGRESPQLIASDSDRLRYEQSAALYSRHQLLDLLDHFVQAQGNLRFSPSSQVSLEALLLHLLRSHKQLPIELLVQRLTELEASVDKGIAPPTAPPPTIHHPQFSEQTPSKDYNSPTLAKAENPSPQLRHNTHRDTLLQFSAVELQGTLEKKPLKP